MLAWVCLVPAGIAIRTAGPWEGLACGLFFGFFIWMTAIWWVCLGLNRWTDIPMSRAWLYTFLYCGYAALPYAMFGLANGLAKVRGKALGPVLNAALLTLFVTWLPNLFPGNPSHSLYVCPVFIQTLDLAGVPGLFFVLNLVNLWLAEAGGRWLANQPAAKPMVLACVLFTLISGYGQYRLYQFREGAGVRTVTLASVQSNISLDTADAARAVQKAVDLSAVAVHDYPGVQALIWPEMPVWYDFEGDPDGRGILESAVADLKRPFVVCIGEMPQQQHGYFNSAMMINGAGKKVVYRKRRLLPFGEYLPLEKKWPWLRTVFPGTLNYRPGQREVLFDLAPSVKAIPTICYEIIFPDQIRSAVRRGGNLILNMTDDAWFGNSPASGVHLALGLFRAVEFRPPMVMVTNSGNGCFVKASGEIEPGSRTPLFAPKVTCFPLKIFNKKSFYLTTGNFFLYGLTLYALLAVLAKRKAKSPLAPPPS